MTFFETLLGTVTGSRALPLSSSFNEATCPSGEYWVVFRTDNINAVISTGTADNSKVNSGVKSNSKAFHDLKPMSLGGTDGYFLPAGRMIILEPGEILQSYCNTGVGTPFTISWIVYRFAKVSV